MQRNLSHILQNMPRSAPNLSPTKQRTRYMTVLSGAKDSMPPLRTFLIGRINDQLVERDPYQARMEAVIQ